MEFLGIPLEYVGYVLILLLKPLIWHARRIAVISAVFLLLFLASAVLKLKLRPTHPWPHLAAASLWGLFAVWEHYCTVQRYNIRPDLVHISPFLVLVAVWSIVVLIVDARMLLRKSSPAEPASMQPDSSA